MGVLLSAFANEAMTAQLLTGWCRRMEQSHTFRQQEGTLVPPFAGANIRIACAPPKPASAPPERKGVSGRVNRVNFVLAGLSQSARANSRAATLAERLTLLCPRSIIHGPDGALADRKRQLPAEPAEQLHARKWNAGASSSSADANAGTKPRPHDDLVIRKFYC